MTRAETLIDEQEADEMHEAMDYAQHEGTWGSFTQFVKWGVIELAIVVLALFCFIQALQPVLGVLLLLLAVALPLGNAFLRTTR